MEGRKTNVPYTHKIFLLSIFFFLVLNVQARSLLFNITEDFDINFFGNLSNVSGNYVKNMFNSSPNVTEIFKDNHAIKFLTSSSVGTIKNFSNEFYGNSLKFRPYSTSGFHTATYFVNFTDCYENDCYFTNETRLIFNLTFQNVALNPAGADYVWGFIKKYNNYTTTLNHDIPWGYVSYSGGTWLFNDTMSGVVSYRTHGSNDYMICNYTGLFEVDKTNASSYRNVRLNYTMGDLIVKEGKCQLDWNEPIIGFSVGFYHMDGSSIVNQTIDNLYITDLFSGVNQYPDVNITTQYTCLLDRDDEVILNFNMSYYDPEGDIVYVGLDLQSNAEINVEKVIDYQDRFMFWNIPDYDFMQNTIQTNIDYCSFEREYFNDSKIEVKKYDGQYMLELENDCTGLPYFVYDMEDTLLNMVYQTTIHDLNSNGEHLNFTFYSYNNTIVDNWGIEYISGNMSIYTIDSGVKNEIMDRKLTEEMQSDGLAIIYDGSSGNRSALHIDGNSVSFNRTGVYDKYRYISIQFSGLTYQEWFVYRGNDLNITLNTTLPNRLFAKYGYNTFTYYYTDEFHTPDYISKQKTFYVGLCLEENITTINYDPNVPIVDEVNPVYLVKTTLGVSLVNYLTEMDAYERGKQAIMVIFVFMFFGMWMSMNLLLRGLSSPVPYLFLSSLACMILSIIVAYNVQALVFGILFSISLALSFTPSLVGGR